MNLTGVGAVVVILVTTVLGAVVDRFLAGGPAIATGIMFTAGCVGAAVKTARRDLPVVAVAPPVLFVLAVLLIHGTASSGGTVAITTALALDAPWLLLGTMAAVIIGLSRGLLGAMRQLGPTRRPPDPGV